MNRLQAATDTIKELAVYYAVLLLVAASVFAMAEGTSLANAIYWAATTATSTGYGDLSPKTWVGKLDAILLMHVSIFLIAPLVIVRLIDRLNVNRDAFTHDEQEVMKQEIVEIRQGVNGIVTYLNSRASAPLADLEELYRRIQDGVFYDDYDEDSRLMGVLRTHLESLRGR